MIERHEYLNIDEQNRIKKILRTAYITSGSIGLLIIILIQIFYFAGNSNFSILYLETISIILIIGIIFLTRFINRNLRNDLNQGLKIINEYEIENKVSYEDNDPGIGGQTIKYYLVSESRKFYVDKEKFEKAEIGDKILEHLTPKVQEILKIEINKRASK